MLISFTRRAILAALQLAIGLNAAAHDCEGDLTHGAPSRVALERAQDRPLNFKNVEVYRRNNGVGLQQVGDLRFEKWIELPISRPGADNFIGLTRDWSIYHLVHWQGRSIARLLNGPSGEREEIREIFLFQDEILVAVTSESKVKIYSPLKWLKSPMKSVFQKGAVFWGASTAVGIGALYLLAPDLRAMGMSDELLLPMSASFIGAANFMNSFFFMLFHYEHYNTFPDGFVGSSIRFTDVTKLEKELANLTPEQVKSLLTAEHFYPPAEEDLFPSMPELAREDIR